MSAQVFSQINMPKAVKTAVLYTVLLHLPSQFIRSGKRFDSDPRVWSPNHYCTRNLLYVLPWPVSHFSLHDVDLQSNNAINVNNRYFFFMSSCDTTEHKYTSEALQCCINCSLFSRWSWRCRIDIAQTLESQSYRTVCMSSCLGLDRMNWTIAVRNVYCK